MPLVTIVGDVFSSRVAGSLLRTLGLPDLICTSQSEYESRILELARDKDQLAAIRARLNAAREVSGVFDGSRFARKIEEAYATMWNIHRSGESPRSFAVQV